MSWKHAAGKFSCFFFYAAGFLVVAILLLSPSVTQAVDKYWNVASGDWSDTNPCPWNPSPEPTSSDDAYIDNGGTATITQDGEKCSHLYLNVSGASGTVEMSDGTLSVGNDAYVGYSGTGTFTQTGGTNSIANNLFLGRSSGSSGTYNLAGTGQLSALAEYVGTSSGTGTFTQTGGTNTATYINIELNGTYSLPGGTLNINGGFVNQGTWDLSASSAVINIASSMVTLSGSIVATTSNATLNIDSNSLLIVPNGYDPKQYFAQINNSGILHQPGSALDIPSAYSIFGAGSINDHVTCEGSLSATSGSINLNGGLSISNAGTVRLGNGTLCVDDTISGMDSGALAAYYQYIGNSGTGAFTQTGGTNSITNYFYLGYNSGSRERIILAVLDSCQHPTSILATPARAHSRRPAARMQWPLSSILAPFPDPAERII